MSTDYNSKNLASLREECKSRNITNIPRKKADVIKALQSYDEEHNQNKDKNSESKSEEPQTQTQTFKAPEPKKKSLKRGHEKSESKNDSNDEELDEPSAKRRKISKKTDTTKSKSRTNSKSPKSKSKSKTKAKSQTKSKDNSDCENENEDEDDEDDSKENIGTQISSNTKSKSTDSDGNSQDKLKIVCYNINGVRAAAKNGLAKFLESQDADMVCFSEMKADLTQNPLKFGSKYEVIWYDCTEKKGYAGSCILTKLKPINIIKGIGCEDAQGRAIIVEYAKFYLINTYVPNSGQKLKFEDRRKAWDIVMKKYLKKLQDKKPIIWTGDLNVAIEDWDVYDGETNKNRCKTAGFTPYERKNFRNILNDLNLIDSWRRLYPESKTDGYTFFTARSRGKDMKKENLGWRLDYFIVSKQIMPLIENITIEREVGCSDHVPLVLTIQNPNNHL